MGPGRIFITKMGEKEASTWLNSSGLIPKTIHPAITRLFQHWFCNYTWTTWKQTLVLKSSKKRKKRWELTRQFSILKGIHMCSCIVPRGHYRFPGQRRVNSPLLPRLISNRYIKRHLACLAKTYLRCLLSGWGSTPVWKNKERGCLLSRLRSVKVLAARVPVWPLSVNFHFQTSIRIAPFGTRRGPRRQYVITFLKFYFPSLLLSSYLMTCKSHFALSKKSA